MTLPLFDAIEAPPPWWTADDASAVGRFAEIETLSSRISEIIDRNAGEWTCRRCQFWISKDGLTGDCSGPELALGATTHKDSCEQFFGRGIEVSI